MALCPSSQERWPRPRRSVKKSRKIFLWVTMPDRIATSIAAAAAPTIQRAQMTDM